MTSHGDEFRVRLAPVLGALPPDSRVLVTGGSGFIGTNLVEGLVRHCAVANVDVAPPRHAGHANLWVNLDIREEARLQAWMKEFQPSLVLHAAARTDLSGRQLDDYDSNTVGTEALLGALQGIGFAGVAVFFSSMLTNRPGATSHTLGQGHPDTPYGESKLQMEEHIRRAQLSYRHHVVRPTSIWGPWFGEPYRAFFTRVLRKTYFNPGPRLACKTFGFVWNTVYQTLALANQATSTAAPIYLGDAPPVRVDHWAQEIADLAGVRGPHRLPYAAAYLAALAGDVVEGLGLRSPFTSRRLRNMTRDNTVDLGPIASIAPLPPWSLTEGTRQTLGWLDSQSARRQ